MDHLSKHYRRGSQANIRKQKTSQQKNTSPEVLISWGLTQETTYRNSNVSNELVAFWDEIQTWSTFSKPPSPIFLCRIREFRPPKMAPTLQSMPSAKQTNLCLDIHNGFPLGSTSTHIYVHDGFFPASYVLSTRRQPVILCWNQSGGHQWRHIDYPYWFWLTIYLYIYT